VIFAASDIFWRGLSQYLEANCDKRSESLAKIGLKNPDATIAAKKAVKKENA